MSNELNLNYDQANDVLTIEGIRYSGNLFRELGFAPIDTCLKIVSRHDGVVTVTKIVESPE